MMKLRFGGFSKKIIILNYKEERKMKKQLIIIGVTVVMLAIGLSGCNEEKQSDGKKGYTMTYAELYSDVRFLSDSEIPTLQSYKEGDIINIQDQILTVRYNENAQPNPITLVTIDVEKLPLCFLGDKTLEYTAGSNVIIPAHVKKYNLEGVDVIWLEEWYYYYLLTPTYTPDIQFKMDDDENTLLVIKTESDVFWSDFEITGSCDTSNLGTYVELLDKITDCSGTITITYIPSSEVIGSWTFT